MRRPNFLTTRDHSELPSRVWLIGYGVGIGGVAALLIVASFSIGGKPQSSATNSVASGATSSPSSSVSAAHSSTSATGTKTSAAPAIPSHATVRIISGDSGLIIARKLAAAHVVATSDDFYQLLLIQPDATLSPGTYTLPTKLAPEDALSALNDPSNRVQVKLVIPEGFTAAQIYARAAKAAKLSVPQFEAAAKNPVKLGVPASAPNVEGWLFPATYTFEPGVDAPTVLRTMVARTKQALLDAGLEGASANRQQQALTLASIVQKESGSEADDAKVARVFTNRIAAQMPLQSDATVSYGAGGSTVVPTKAEYASKNGYNTYARTGLPVGPISNPGDAAIKAALHPASGKWLYFVTVNLQTGRTVFSTTLAQHDKAAAEFRAWLKAHPDYR